MKKSKIFEQVSNEPKSSNTSLEFTKGKMNLITKAEKGKTSCNKTPKMNIDKKPI